MITLEMEWKLSDLTEKIINKKLNENENVPNL